MRIAILAMDDPLYTNSFIKEIIDARKDNIVLFTYVAKGDRMTIGKGKSKTKYLVSLFFIMGPIAFIKNTLITITHKFKKKLSDYGLFEDPTVYYYAKKIGIKVDKINNPNSMEFCSQIEKLNPDIIINQCQAFIKKRLLDIPKIGIINRHNALLPKNRGRLTPFWVLYKEEKETGVSIHFLEEKLDTGDIIIQKKFSINKNDNFNTIVEKNYQLAIKAILEALDLLESADYQLIANEDHKSTYNTVPTLNEAWEYRKRNIFR